MKNFAVICLLVAMPALLRAGSFDIVLNGGMVKNTGPIDYGMGSSSKGGNASAAGAFRLMYNINKNWQVGMSISYMPLSYKAQTSPFYVNDIWQSTTVPGTIEYSGYLADPAIPILIEANHNFTLGKFELYSGISAGIFTQYTPFGSYRTNEYWSYGIQGGLMGGMQAGANWFFVPWCGLNMQMAAHYYEPYELVAFPVTAGLRFRL